MSVILQQFHFLQPGWLLLLLLLPLAWWLGTRPSAATMALSRLVDAALLPHLLRGGQPRRRLAPWLLLGAWTLGALALAGPTWDRQAQPLYAARAAQVVAVSLSQHMLARDVVPSRLDRARFKARDLLNSNRDGMNALVAYAGAAFVVAPLTSDAHSLDDLLAALGPDTMPVDGNDAAAAIQTAVKLVHDGDVQDASLVLITDDADAAAVQAARQAYAAGLRVSVLGMGTLRGAPIPQADGGWLHDTRGDMVLASRDDRALAAVAAAGGGRYMPMTADHADNDILHTQLQVANDPRQSGQSGAVWQDRGPWLLLPLLLLAALSFRRGWLCVLALGLLPVWPVTANAGAWSDLWQRPDQQAAAALQGGDAKRAQALAQDPAWRGAADYRAGDYAAAAQALEHVPGARAAYNRGNALARQALYAEALDDYDRALQLDPALADAKANRQAVEQWLSQHKPQSTPQDQQAPGQKQQKQQQGQQQGQSSDQPSAGEKTGKDPADQSGQNAQQKPGTNSRPAPATSAGANAASASTAAPPPGTEADKGQGTDRPPAPMSAQQRAEQQARTAQAQRALQQQMDKALAERPSTSPAATHELGAIAADDPMSKLPIDVRRALQSVQDDPGALLRRKFELEYQQRHGGVVDAQEQP